ncbi:MAG: M16 family metallopeptidase [Vampirovibrionales bacterium]
MMSSLTLSPLFHGTDKHRLECGATLWHVPLAQTPRIALLLALPGGNTLDPLPGSADMIDNLLIQGTETKDAEAIALAIDSLSLELSISTRRDATWIHATFLPEDTQASLSLIAELFLFSTLEDLAREREKVRGEIQMSLDTPQAVAADLMSKTLFADTPYGFSESVLLESLDSLTLTGLQKHYRSVYRPDRLVGCVAGDIDLASFTQQFEEAFGAEDTFRIAAGTSTATGIRLNQMHLKEPQVVRATFNEAAQVHVYQSWLMPEATHPDTVALSVLNTILGGAGLSSRLFVELRDKQGLAYSVRSRLTSQKYRGSFSLYIGTDPSKLSKALHGFKAQLERLIHEPVSPQELAEAQRNMMGRRHIGLETASQQASAVLSNVLLGRDMTYLQQYDARIQAVTAHDLQRVAQKYLTQPSVLSLAGPEAVIQDVSVLPIV